jgi:hypothetical protein
MPFPQYRDGHPICWRCQQIVEAPLEHWGIHEYAHYICFHLEFEHVEEGEECDSPFCPASQFWLVANYHGRDKWDCRNNGASWRTLFKNRRSVHEYYYQHLFAHHRPDPDSRSCQADEPCPVQMFDALDGDRFINRLVNGYSEGLRSMSLEHLLEHLQKFGF